MVGVEMDKRPMTATGQVLEFAGFAAAGAAVAWLHLLALLAAVKRLVVGGARAAAALTALRLALLVGALTAACLSGPGPLIALSLGLLVARVALTKRIGGVA
jgi:hypothetical protein